jgi:hypothetical protein
VNRGGIMQIGRKIYFDSFGNIIKDAGEREVDVKETTMEEDLIGINVPEGTIISYIQYPFGETPQDYLMNPGNYMVDTKTNTLCLIV